MKRTLDGTIKNILRSGQPYHKLRRRIVGELIKYSQDALEVKSAFLLSTLLQIKKKSGWMGLCFNADDWSIMDRLIAVRRGSMVERNMLSLLVAYIAANLGRISELGRLEADACSLVLGSKADQIEAAIHSLDAIERQSLIVFRLFSAANAVSPKYIAKYFGQERHSVWVRQRFLYPLIYFSVNHPSARDLDEALLSIFPWLETSPSERRLTRYLLKSVYEHGDSLSFKCYVSLLAHPFDALSMLTDHFEGRIAARSELTEAEAEALEALSQVLPQHRIATLNGISRRTAQHFSATGVQLRFGFHMTEAETSFFSAYFDILHKVPVAADSKFLSALGRIRWSRYPTRADFEAVVGLSARYDFLPLGQIIDLCLTSTYMVSRREQSDEYRSLSRCAHFFGAFNPFLITSPRGGMALQTSYFEWDGQGLDIEAEIDRLPHESEDRTWMKWFHWDARDLERKLRLNEYFQRVRASMRPSISSRYLSGVDWRWLQSVIDALRIAPFRNQNGVYTLLLRAIEERDRQPNYLRTALRPTVAPMNSVGEFVDYLMDEYGRDALAAVRTILTPEMILKLQLESYYAAALAERLDALTRCAERFGFDPEMLTEEQYLTEQQALSSALTLMNVHSAQFAVSWEAIRSAAMSSAAEMYAAYDAVNRTFNELPLLSDAIRTSAMKFSNRQSVLYALRNRQWPAAVAVERVIDTFLSHPSHGIESVLAARIRHDNLRYEFGLVVDAVKRSRINGLREADFNQLIPDFDAAITDVINRWVDCYMHTAPTPERQALFNFVPSEKQLVAFIEEPGEDKPLEVIVGRVLQWLREQLSAHLSVARSLLDGELRAAIHSSLAEVELAHRAAGVSQERVEKVKKALQAALDTRCDELREWFDTPSGAAAEQVAMPDIKLAVDGRYRSERETGRLEMRLCSTASEIANIEADSVRLVFDIWSELAKNAMKYSGRRCARVRIHSYRENGMVGLMFSSLRARSEEVGEDEYAGEPSVATSAAIFKSGRSGLPKVAHLAASVAKSPTSVVVRRRWAGFHVFVPLRTSAT